MSGKELLYLKDEDLVCWYIQFQEDDKGQLRQRTQSEPNNLLSK